MVYLRKSVIAACAGFVAALAVQPGMAQEDGWSRKTLQYDVEGVGEVFRYTGDSVMTTQEEGPGIFFYCLAGVFNVAVSSEPVDFEKLVSKTTQRTRTVSGHMSINGEVVHTGEWEWMQNLRIFRAEDYTSKAKLFNAVVRGDRVSIDFDTVFVVPVSLPPVNDDFKAFAKSCKLTQ